MSKPKVEKTPSLAQLEAELHREKYRSRYSTVLGSTVCALIVVAAVAVLVATLWMPALQIYGSSMTPSLQDGEIVLSVKDAAPETGEIIAFYYNNKVLLKRLIGLPGDKIDIAEDGTVIVNDAELVEPYVSEIAIGECDVEFPYQVPENRYFVLGDHRAVSIDSRSTSVGCIAEENMIGKVMVRVLPVKKFGMF